ncbi:MAG: acyl transferase domain-containing protein/3-hydroxymyristoyl [Myxococcota bacterium]
MKLACDKLHDGELDVALAGAVQAADDLFLHMGFCALGAYSLTGRSRPFNRDADGLVAAEGAGFVALKRLSDARRDGDVIHGVIRGVGLSNDGRGKSLLAPAQLGQQRAMVQAYSQAGLTPSDVSLLECHATGTAVGDRVEVASTSAVYQGCSDVPMGSLKSNMGHLITVAGVAGLIKVVEAMRAKQRPPTLHASPAIDALRGSPFRLLHAAEAWPVDSGPRTAAVSAFGFGGNNAHLVVSEECSSIAAHLPGPARPAATCPIALVAVGAVVGAAADTSALQSAIHSGTTLVAADATGSPAARLESVDLNLRGLRFPPNALKHSLGQQLATLRAARAAVAEVGSLPRERTGILIGLEPDAEVARWGARWRLGTGLGDPITAATFVDALESSDVVGSMPNIPANRLSSQFDIAGPAFTLSSGADSGLAAVHMAARALRHHELDAVIVGAVDLACEPVHQAALAATAVAATPSPPGDAAVVWILKRLPDAEAAGDSIVAVLPAPSRGDADEHPTPAARFDDHAVAPTTGTATAASGLVNATVAAICLRDGVQIDGQPWPAPPANGPRKALAHGGTTSLDLAEPPTRNAKPSLHLFAGSTPADLLRRLETGEAGGEGPCRAAFVATSAGLQARLAAAARTVANGETSVAGVHFRTQPIEGELAFAYTGAGAAYHGMGRDLVRSLPGLVEALTRRSKRLPAALAWAHCDTARDEQPPAPTVLEQLWGASALCQLHTELSTNVLGLKPSAALGYSSGETNALLGMGIWSDIDALVTDSESTPLFTEQLAGTFDAVKAAWGHDVAWASWTLLHPVAQVRAALDREPHVHLAIVHTPTDCVIAGDRAGCQRVVTALGAARCLPLSYNLAVHVPELSQVEAEWLELHRRATKPAPGVRIYGNALGAAYEPTAEACAQAILGQANRTLELPATIEAAWADGVRIFVEHGPRAAYAGWIREILGKRDAVVVSLDRKGQGIEATLDAVAALWVAGVAVDHAALTDRLVVRPARATKAASNDRPMAFAAHPPPVRVGHQAQAMAPAPSIPVADWRWIAATAPTPGRGAQQMPAPPVWPQPSATTLATPSASGRSRPQRIHEAAVTRRKRPAPLTPSVSPIATSLPHTVFEQHAAQMAQLGELQRNFAAQQQALHEQFLAVRHTGLQALLDAARPVTRFDSAAGVAALPRTASVAIPAASARPQPRPLAAPAPAAARFAVATKPAIVTKPARAAKPRPAQRQAIAFTREQLVTHAGGKISTLFGPAFEAQDGFAHQVRMPLPPLLLCDRVVDIDATPASMTTGSITTETDVTWDSWWLHNDRMPAGIMIEAGQADLFLISYLGVDLILDRSRGERAYRLLGCELTYHGDLPRVGDTVRYDIHVDGHARQGDKRLFFFHYGCVVDDGGLGGPRPQLTVREGQAGFFSAAELADSDGCLWTPEATTLAENPTLDPPAIACERTRFDAAQLRAFSHGDAATCFGPGFEAAHAHTRSPSIQAGQMLLLDRISHFEPGGGPWQRGYLRAELDITPECWFFEGHFKNDPCMPGTLMFEGCLQAMAVYIAGLGYTVARDGWRFQPVAEMPFKLACRGQVLPTSRLLTTEVFVEEIIAGPKPTLIADLLCTVDGLKAFHARRVALELVPDWPLGSKPELLRDHQDRRPVAEVDGFKFGYESLLACAWGQPSKAFGPMYAPFDGTRKVARLPGPPYHFLSRVAAVEGPIGVMKAGARVTFEYDIPPDAWYFADNGCRTMPFAVLLEAALQPCGWLASYVGSALTIDRELGFRNLDGTGTLHAELLPNACLDADGFGILETEVVLTGASRIGGMIIQSFEVQCYLVGPVKTLVYEMTTKFGFFEPSALASQAGLPAAKGGHGDPGLLQQASTFQRDLVSRSDKAAHYWEAGRPRLSAPKLLMLDRVTGFWPTGGPAGLGLLRAEKDVAATSWFFKAHFFQDPVQPGSLGIEAMIQLLQVYMLEAGLDAGIAAPRFEPLALGAPLTWSYRGQVRIPNTLIQSTVEIVDVERGDGSVTVLASASLWVDGVRIYEATGLGMRIVSGGAGPDIDPPSNTVTLDPATDTWLGDHRPTWTKAALPMMSMIDLLAEGAGRQPVVSVRDVRVASWVLVDEARQLHTECEGDKVRLFDGTTELASATVITGNYPPAPTAWPALVGPPAASPYESGTLFHGPAFQVLASLVQTAEGASSRLRTESGVPLGVLNPALLDGATHGIPHANLQLWDARLASDKVAYPALVQRLEIYGPTPNPQTDETVRCEVRFSGLLGGPSHPVFKLQLIGSAGVWAEMTLVEACFPKGALGSAPAHERRAFLRDRHYVAGLSLAATDLGDGVQTTTLDEATVAESDWLPGTIEAVYGCRSAGDIATAEHIARAHELHPCNVKARLPLTSFDLSCSERQGPMGPAHQVAGDGRGRLDLGAVRPFWTHWFGIDDWPVQDLYYGLIERFLDRVVLQDPAGFSALRGQSVLYLANHQVGVESLIFSIVASALGGVPTVTLAKAEHRDTWLGRLIRFCFQYAGVRDPQLMTFFDRADKGSLGRIIKELMAGMQAGRSGGQGRSVMVHVEGTRSLECRTPVQQMSGAFIDMAIAAGVPIVPVRFSGGLPTEALSQRLEFPIGMGKQTIWIGAALAPSELATMHYGERKRAVIDAINGLGGNPEAARHEVPAAGDSDFSAACAQRQIADATDAEAAVLRTVLAQLEAPGEALRQMLDSRGADGQPSTPWLAEFAKRYAPAD